MTEKIMKYLAGEMNELEKGEFEKELSENKDLREELELHKKVDSFLVDVNELEDLKDIVKETHKDYLHDIAKTKTKSLLKWSVGIAASIAILLGGYFVSDKINNTPAKIYKNNYVAWNLNDIQRGDKYIALFDKLDKAYENNDYAEIIKYYDTLPLQIANEPTVVLMYSCALMEQERFHEAVNALNSIEVNNNDFLNAHFTWYKALCYLQFGKIDFSVKELKKLNNSEYKQKAALIISKIEK